MQHYAVIYLLQNFSACFGFPPHPSSGVHKTVTVTCGLQVIISEQQPSSNVAKLGRNLATLEEGYCSDTRWFKYDRD